MNPWIDMQPGIRRRTLASGEALMQVLVTLAAGSHLPQHAHASEQMGHIVSGSLILTVESVTHEYSPGDTFLIPGHVPHSAQVTEDTVVIDTFSPPRPDMLTEDSQKKAEQQRKEHTPHA